MFMVVCSGCSDTAAMVMVMVQHSTFLDFQFGFGLRSLLGIHHHSLVRRQHVVSRRGRSIAVTQVVQTHLESFFSLENFSLSSSSSLARSVLARDRSNTQHRLSLLVD